MDGQNLEKEVKLRLEDPERIVREVESGGEFRYLIRSFAAEEGVGAEERAAAEKLIRREEPFFEALGRAWAEYARE